MRPQIATRSRGNSKAGPRWVSGSPRQLDAPWTVLSSDDDSVPRRRGSPSRGNAVPLSLSLILFLLCALRVPVGSRIPSRPRLGCAPGLVAGEGGGQRGQDPCHRDQADPANEGHRPRREAGSWQDECSDLPL
ncbi:hypothetical protein BS78_07G136900 [Paspalum vaginatum]|nr:hypothetical protein BS78_07G136900 [Paspalum vaginatum]